MGKVVCGTGNGRKVENGYAPSKGDSDTLPSKGDSDTLVPASR